MKKIFVATALASCSFISSLIFSTFNFVQGKYLGEACLIGLGCAAMAEPVPNVNFASTNDNEEIPSKILRLTDDKLLSLQTETQNNLSGDPNSVTVFTPPPVIIPPPPLIVPPPPVEPPPVEPPPVEPPPFFN